MVKKIVEFKSYTRIEKNNSFKSYTLREKIWVPKIPEAYFL